MLADVLRRAGAAARPRCSHCSSKEDVGILPRDTGSFLSRAAVPLVAGVNSPQPVVHPTQRVVRLLVDGSCVACNTMIRHAPSRVKSTWVLPAPSPRPGQTDASYTLLHLMHTPSNGEATAPHSSCSTSGESSRPSRRSGTKTHLSRMPPWKPSCRISPRRSLTGDDLLWCPRVVALLLSASRVTNVLRLDVDLFSDTTVNAQV